MTAAPQSDSMRGGPGFATAVLDEREVAEVGPDLVGHKAANLAWLVARGYTVPRFCVLTVEACTRILRPVAPEIDTVLAALDPQDRGSLRDTAAAIGVLIAELAVPEDIRSELKTAIGALGTHILAVRSSARGEDSAADSFAGQLDTVLGVSPDQVDTAVLTCLASAYSERALFYRARRGLADAVPEPAVIVQALVDSTVAGVAFACNPQSGDPQEAVVSAAFGLGEGVVSGSVECDTYFVDVRSRTLTTRAVADKRSRVILGAAGTEIETIAASTAAALDDDRVIEVVDIALRLSVELGAPQDIEWAVDANGTMYLLQTRPITATGAHETVFDNVNVAESYPGLSSPLTFSVVRLAYEQVFRACHRSFGASRATVRANAADLYPYLVGLAHGHIYYNISNWYRLFLQIPGMESAIEGWEAALGIENRYRRPAAPRSAFARLRAAYRRVRIVVILLFGWLRLPKRLAGFFAVLGDFTADLGRRFAPETPERERDPHQLLGWLERCITQLVPAYSVQIFNDFLAQQLFHVVGGLIERSGITGDEALTVRNELFCGEKGVDSVEPVVSVLALAARIRDDEALTALFASERDAVEVWSTLHTDSRFGEFLAACAAHIDAYGDRTVDELKLETDPLALRPHRLVPALRNYVRGGQNVEQMQARERDIRHAAEARIGTALRGHPLRRIAFRVVLRQARATVKQRENMRLGRSRCFGLVKRVFRALGAQFHEAGLLDAPHDIFYLTYEEITALIRGTAVDADPRALVAARKADYDRWRGQPMPARIVTSGIAAAADNSVEFAEYDSTATVLTGIGCAPGRVEAPALVLHEPEADTPIDGEVLVATTTDPGWVFLMVAAGGLVSEKGSVLSHTAIIGRELGITTVVGVRDATSLLRSGDRVALDGRAGTVTITGRRSV
ncbi:PEP/pyruvate-binding domain-containing protein [Nocardia sp. NPDC049149]|uniref:PEP/pyruvate-binding domain-containing protein n=1 Tax=Nocardia sp. NPDC049149 TaxID=3364315 RepID=UPI00371C082F